MALTISKTATTLAKTLMCRNVADVMLTSTKGQLHQVKLADNHCITHEDEDHDEDKHNVLLPIEETYKIHTDATDGGLKVNLENISNNMQREILEHLGPILKSTTDDEHIPEISFNYLAEEIFINNLYMAFRQHGYEGTFTRYNHDKGLATFTLVESKEPVMRMYSYFKSRHPNLH